MQNIRNKIIFGVIFIAVFSAGVYLIILVAEKGASKDSTAALNLKPKSVSQFDPEKELEKFGSGDAQPQKKVQKHSSLLDTNYFSIALPLDWKSEATDTLPIIAVDTKEKITDEKAQKIGFRTNLSINSADLGEVLLEDYVAGTKTKIIQSISFVKIIREGNFQQSSGDKQMVYYMHIESTQQDIKFSTFLIFVSGKDKTVWAFSFNTLEESWPYYQNIFQQIVDSIVMKP